MRGALFFREPFLNLYGVYPKMDIIKYFRGAFLFSFIALIAAFLIGFIQTSHYGVGVSSLFICLILGILEFSLSFDNAVVNASSLKKMEKIWQKYFLTWGMVIAVFGMRLLFPLVIVGVAAKKMPWGVLYLAIKHPAEYAHILAASHMEIMGFGGAFLSLVGLKYFLDAEKEIHWVGVIERKLASLGQIKSFEILVVLGVILGVSHFIETSEKVTFLFSSLSGVMGFILVEALGHLLSGGEGAGDLSKEVAKAGLGGFIYLEMMDASFSFDGVIGAFALSNNIFIIALGLGIGSMFVRSLTVLFVEKEVLGEYRYLEHGAFWAILILALCMFIEINYEIPEIITGSLGMMFILLSFLSSLFWKKKHSSTCL